jgi:hypothetical protein
MRERVAMRVEVKVMGGRGTVCRSLLLCLALHTTGTL